MTLVADWSQVGRQPSPVTLSAQLPTCMHAAHIASVSQRSLRMCRLRDCGQETWRSVKSPARIEMCTPGSGCATIHARKVMVPSAVRASFPS